MSFHEFAKRGRTFHIDPTSIVDLVEKLHQFMFIKDLDGSFIYGNAPFLELMGCTAQGLHGKKDSSFFSKHLCEQFEKVDCEVRRTGNEWSGEEKIDFPSGKKLVVWCNKTPYRDDHDQIVGVVGIFVDVTRNHEAHSQTITERTNDLVHEILIPMDSISSNLESLLAHENKEYSLDGNERIDLLKLSQAELHILGMHAENMQRTLVGDDERDMVFRHVNIKNVLNNCRTALSAVALTKNVDFRSIKLKDFRTFPLVEMFEPDMTRAFKNIYHNAVKYSYSGSPNSPYPKRWIETVVGPAGTGKFFIEIENFGVGITPEELPFIFDVGKRGKYSIDRQRTGSGIGLSQVKRIIARHGGTVSASSNRLPHGAWITTLRVVLPYEQSIEALRYEDNLEDSLG